MSRSVQDLLESIAGGIPREDNPLVRLIASGQADRAVIGALAAEETHIVRSDRRSFLLLASRSTDQPAVELYTWLAQGESAALGTLPALAAASGLDAEAVGGYEPRVGCQAYPAYLAWLALNGDPAEVALALAVNFAAWGGYCATIADSLRRLYGYDDEACAFFDFFATPSTELRDRALEAARAAIGAGRGLPDAARYARLTHGYEMMFWRTLADLGH